MESLTTSGPLAIAQELDVRALAYGEPFPPMPFLRFGHPNPETNETLRTSFCEAMLERGVLLHPRHMWFIGLAHQASDIDVTLELALTSMKIARQQLK